MCLDYGLLYILWNYVRNISVALASRSPKYLCIQNFCINALHFGRLCFNTNISTKSWANTVPIFPFLMYCMYTSMRPPITVNKICPSLYVCLLCTVSGVSVSERHCPPSLWGGLALSQGPDFRRLSGPQQVTRSRLPGTLGVRSYSDGMCTVCTASGMRGLSNAAGRCAVAS